MVAIAGAPPTLPPRGIRPPPPVASSPTSVVSARAALHAQLSGKRLDIPSVAEIVRITSLSTERLLTPEEVEHISRQEVLASAFDGPEKFRLSESQARTLFWFDLLGGAFCAIGVGKGKTLITIMAAERAFRAGIQRMVLVMPPGACHQFSVQGLPFARKRVPVTVPFHFIGGRSAAERRKLSRSKKIGCYVMASSQFSTTDTRSVDDQVGVLDAIDPQLFIIDEVHEFKRKGTARTDRLMDFIEQKSPAGVVLSGTITNKSIEDYHHLIRWCLGKSSPLPMSRQMAQQWGQIIDAEADPTPSMTGPLRPLIDWARMWFREETFSDDKVGFRRAYRLRLTSAPGVIASGDEDLGTSLVIKTEPVAKPEEATGWAQLQEHIKEVEELWLTPSGDEIEHAFHTYKWMHELSAGFYNLLTWPETSEMVRRKGVSAETAEQVLVGAKAHHEARQQYARKLRDWLDKYGRAGLDTPMLVGAAMHRNGWEDVGRELYDVWKYSKDLEEDATPPWNKPGAVLERDSHAVQVCDYKVRAAIEWAEEITNRRENKGKYGAIIWYHHIEVGEWLEKLARAARLNYLHAPAGPVANKALADLSNGNKVVLASISAHGQAKELQHFQHQYVLQWPRSAKTAEQMLGRCHRRGQQADELVVVKNDTIDWDIWNFATSLNNALYIQQTLGNDQKMIYCGYDPMPRVFPPEILRERGFQGVKKLDKEGKELMTDLFGGFSV